MENMEGQKMAKNKIVETLKEVDFRSLKFPLAVVYNKPKDFPFAYVVRIWDTDKPTDTVFISKELEECRREIKAAGFTLWVGRDKSDHPCVVETWM